MAQADLLTRIDENYASLSKRHRRLADYIKTNPAEAAFLSAEGLGAKAGASESTAIRFAGNAITNLSHTNGNCNRG